MSALDDIITLLLRSFHDLENNNTEIDPLHYDFDHHVDDLDRTWYILHLKYSYMLQLLSKPKMFVTRKNRRKKYFKIKTLANCTFELKIYLGFRIYCNLCVMRDFLDVIV